MKKTLPFFILLLISYNSYSQEKSKQKEAGITFNNLENFGLTYRIGSDKSLWRFNTLFATGNNFSQSDDDSSSDRKLTGFGIKTGKEFRASIDDQFEFRYGIDLSFQFSKSKTEQVENGGNNDKRISKSTSYSPGINAIIGFNYIAKKKMVIGVEILPNFTYHNTKNTNTITSDTINQEINSESSGFNYGISNSSAMLSLAYRF